MLLGDGVSRAEGLEESQLGISARTGGAAIGAMGMGHRAGTFLPIPYALSRRAAFLH